MADPIRMVLLEIVASIVVIIGFVIFKLKFPKKKINFFYLLIIISLVPVVSIFRPGIYESGDFSLHTYHTISFFQNLKEGNLMPTWGGELNGTYGYPIFMFYYTFPYYITSFFHLLGFSFIFGMKLFHALAFILSGVFFYLWVKEEFDKKELAFYGAVLYLFVPYHLVDQFFRATAGEISIFALLPLLMYSLKKLSKKSSIKVQLLISLSLALIFFAEPAIAVFSIFIILPYAVFLIFSQKKKAKNLFYKYFAASLIALILVAPIAVSHLYMTRFTNHYLQGGEVFFPKVWELLYSPWMFGFLFQGHYGEISYLLGYSQVVIIIGLALLLFKNKIEKQIKQRVIFWLCVFFTCVFFFTSYSKSLWDIFPLIKLAQFSYRFLLPISLVTSILGVFFLQKINNKRVIYLFLFITVIYTILNWGNRKSIPFTDNDYLKSIPLATAKEEAYPEAVPKWWKADSKNLWAVVVPKNHLETVSESVNVKQIYFYNAYHLYSVYSPEDTMLIENTAYFPGWSLRVDGKIHSFDFKNNKYPGRIVFNLKKGLHIVSLKYEDITILAFAKLISLSGFFIIGLFFLTKLISGIYKFKK